VTVSARRQFDLFGEAAVPPAAEAAVAREFAADLPDRAARVRVLTDLETSLLVEAGAGAGKTTQMVERMVALVHTGTATVDQLAAVTFTRKAAAELRERFQTTLEQELRSAFAGGDDELITRIDRALREIDRAYIGTIHSFCARLLRERALDVGLDPDFHETFAVEQERLRHEFFTSHIERLAAQSNPLLARLAAVGLRPQQLRKLFHELTEHADVDFPAADIQRPDPAEARDTLARLLDETLEVMPREEPQHGWDDLQRAVLRLRFYRDIVGWTDDVRFLHALAESLAAVPRATYRRWGGPGAAAVARDLERRFRDFAGPDGAGGRVLRQWWAHRYPLALRFARGAAIAFEEERRRTGALSFQDLLLNAAKLLRESTLARAELGERFRFLLVDEFQDTDPIQAEVLLLLASPPMDEDEGNVADWRSAVPRPGALFVVGDPKQSIYRFRRADMTIYNQVKQRFEQFGAVLHLVANFRSGTPIEDFVNRMFRHRFPLEATEHQAAFAAMHVQRRPEPYDRVAWYPVPKTGKRTRREEVAEMDARRVASWIAAVIESGERKPDDFLVLTRDRRHLTVYAREIEARNLPVQVTGAGVGLEVELEEVRLILQALADPGDAAATLAVLVGLFFGLDYETLAQHVIDGGGSLDFVQALAAPSSPVERALATLHELWLLARREPADVVVAEVIDRFGLLPYAAAGPLGESRAGALLYVLETVRNAALQGDASLHGALTAIEAALDAEEAEAPLEPGRRDAVRIMNLHQAKGLEGNVVILASPVGEWNPPPQLHVDRPPHGRAEGYIVVAERRWRFNDTVLARPLDWDRHQAAEEAFIAAERDRLLYVAATRARQELIVARYDVADESPWGAFHQYLEVGHEALIFPALDAPEPARLSRTATDLMAEAAHVRAQRHALANPGWRADAVTRRVKQGVPLQPVTVLADDEIEAGMAWGKIIHALLELAARGARGGALRSAAETALRSEDAPLRWRNDPERAREAVEMVERVIASDTWRRAQTADRMLVESPFAVAWSTGEYRDLLASVRGPGASQIGAPAEDSRADEARIGGAPVEIIEGVVDLAFRERGVWTLVDYKTDQEGRSMDPDRRAVYQAQLDMYAACWTRITGEPVGERILLFLADDEALRW
jgi:ATP-dependent helicase/nuclease subunit A